MNLIEGSWADVTGRFHRGRHAYCNAVMVRLLLCYWLTV